MKDETTKTRPRILVVDDDPIAREIAIGWLDELGYQTACAISGTDAMTRLSDSHYDVLFADVQLPGRLDGFELSVAAVDRQPHLKVMFVSASAWTPHQSRDPGTTFLHKPYTKLELQRVLAVVLGD
jgi:CheY-like chemotaxis protein